MFGFFRSKKREAHAYVPLTVDLHSHLIPGIDDGAKTMAESLRLLKGLESLGYTKCITTPHVMYDAYANTKASILEGVEGLQKAAVEEGLKIEIKAGAEYYVDEGLSLLIAKDELLLIGGKYLLFETSYSHRPQQLEEIIFQIQSAGYTPMLAHPERYRYIDDPQEEYGALKALGVEFQVNLNSLNGHYGKRAEKNARFLSQAGWIDFLGSDTHNEGHLKNLELVLSSKVYSEVYTKNKIKNSLFG